MSNEELRRLLVNAVPAALPPTDRWARIGARVRRRRNVRVGTSVTLAIVAVFGLGAGVLRVLPSAHARPAVDGPATDRDGIAPAPASTPPSSAAPPPAPAPAPHPATRPPGVAFDPAKIPPGSPGSGSERVVRTNEMPKPSSDGDGIFRTVCLYSHMNNDDPFAAADQAGRSPLNMYWGNTAVAAGAAAKPVTGAGNSTCRGGVVDRSAYWITALIDTKTRAPIAPDLVHVFFDSGYTAVHPGDVQAMPAGLRMLAGGPTVAGSPDHARWNCSDTYRPSPTVPTSCPAGEEITLDLYFPQCWDGQHLDSADHRGHLAYSIEGKGCPGTHPVPLPNITYRLLYPVPPGTDTSGWRLATDPDQAGKPAGLGVQGGWINGWKPDIVSTWIAGCIHRANDCGSHMLGDGRVLDGDR